MDERLPLFVYGTLLPTEPQGALLGPLSRRPAAVRGALYAMPAGYPALVLAGEPGHEHVDFVYGEIVDPPDDRLLDLLDRYEGVDEGLYDRVTCEVRVGLRSERAWVYVMDAARARTGRRVARGRWRTVQRR